MEQHLSALYILVQRGVFLAVVLSFLPLALCALVGLIVGVVQAATQVQEQCLGFLVKLCTVGTLGALLGARGFLELEVYLRIILRSLGELS